MEKETDRMRILNRRHGDREERGAEALAMLIVVPFLVVLVLALIDVGNMMMTRMVVENLARDTARSAAADGGNDNPRTNMLGQPWDVHAFKQLWKNGHCVPSACIGGQKPSLTCTPTIAQQAGDLITCTVNYPFKPINGDLLSGPLGLGMGHLLKPFTITVSARAETGSQG